METHILAFTSKISLESLGMSNVDIDWKDPLRVLKNHCADNGGELSFRNAPKAYSNISSEPMSGIHGRVGAILGQYVLTSPNYDHVLQPQLGEAYVQLRKDMRFGEDDFTVWPQWYVPRLPHLPCVPAPPLYDVIPNRERFSCMWWRPNRWDFTGSATVPADHRGEHLGLINGIEMEEMQRLYKELQACVGEVIDKREELHMINVGDILSNATFLRHANLSLTGALGTFEEKALELVEFQRAWLELKGWMNLCRFTKERLRGNEEAKGTEDCIGCFVEVRGVALEMYTMGVPVWFLRPKEDVIAGGIRIQRPTTSLIKPIHWNPAVVLTEASGFPVIFRGSPRKYGYGHYISQQQFARLRPSVTSKLPPASISGSAGPILTSRLELERSRARTILVDLDQLRAQAPAHPLVPPPSTSSSSRVPQVQVRAHPCKLSLYSKALHINPRTDPPSHRQNKGSKASLAPPLKLRESSAPFAPFHIPAWSEALRKFDQRRPKKEESPPLVYTVPAPSLWDGPKPDRMSLYTLNWLHIRSTWIAKIRPKDSIVQLRAQTWKDILRFGFGSPNPNIPTGPNLQIINKDLTAAGLRLLDTGAIVFESGQILQGPPRSDITGPADPYLARWREVDIYLPQGTLPTEAILREIIWETHEINFRFDLERLDEVLSRVDDIVDRRKALAKCWNSGDDLGDITTVTWGGKDSGLAAHAFKERLPFLRALRSVLETWNSFVLPSSTLGLTFDAVPEDEGLRMERALVLSYVQCFFDLFARPPIFPQRLHPVI